MPEKYVRLPPQYSAAVARVEQSPVENAAPAAAYGRASTNTAHATAADFMALQRTVGNRQLQRIMRSPATSVGSPQVTFGTTRTIQRQGCAASGAANPTGTQTQAQQALADRTTLIETQIEQFLERFSNIPVTVRWQEAGETQSESVTVRPPYFINRENEAQRLSTALGHRTSARGALRTLLRQISGPAPEVPPQPDERATNQNPQPSPAEPGQRHGRTRRPPPRPRAIQAGDVRGRRRALVGKATPEDIQTILQEALDQGLVPAGNDRTHPNSTDLRNWLVRYGLGVDCSGFVSQALNQVMSAVPGGAGVEQLDIADTSASMLTGARSRRARFIRVASPAELCPGDTMGIPGHIRIVMRVETTAEGLEITTAESSSVGDVGPTRAVWLYPDPTRFARLHRRHAGPPPPPRRTSGRRRGRQAPPPVPVPAGPPPAFHWRPANERVTWGRYRPLAELPTAQPTVQPKSLNAPSSEISLSKTTPVHGQRTVSAVRSSLTPDVQRDWSDAPHGGATTSQPGVTSPAAAQGWNSTEIRIGQIRRIPLEGLAIGNLTDASHSAATESAAGKAIVLLPVMPEDPPATVDVLLHLHGFGVGYRQRRTRGRVSGTEVGTVRDVEIDRTEQQLQAHIQAGSTMMIGVLPQGTTHSGFGASGFDSESYLTSIFGRIWPHNPPPTRGHVVLSAHSGGGGEIANMLRNRDQSRLPAQLAGAGGSGVLALFDAINGPHELAAVQRWVKSRLDHDFIQLQTLPTEAEQLAYLSGSLRFRSFYSPGSDYETRNGQLLAETIAPWFRSRIHIQVLRGAWDTSQQRPAATSSAVYQRLFANYQVLRAGGTDHEHILGTADRLRQALDATPQGSPQTRPAQPLVQPARVIQRQSVPQRSGQLVGAVTGSSNNMRSDVLQTMDRLHRLWSLSNQDYDAEYPVVSRQSTGSTIPASLIPLTIAAIRRNEQPTLHREVARQFLNLDLSANVGRGQTNAKADITALQYTLRALGRLSDGAFVSEQAAVTGLPGMAVTTADATIPATLTALAALKVALAGGSTGWAPIHADEGQDAGDRFGGRTFQFGMFSIFLPGGARPASNKVQVFFSPGDVQGESGLNAVLTHGLRGASDTSEWILIGVPGVEPGYNVITSVDIAQCLARIGRPQPVTSLRLSAHSRGYRGLRETIRRRLIPTALVDRVVILDANYSGIASALAGSGIDASKVTAYGVLTGNLALPGARNIRLPAAGMRAIGYSRLIQDAMVTRPDLQTPAAIRAQLLPLPPRGQFTTRNAPSGGRVNIVEFCRIHQAAINTIVRQERDPVRGLMRFIEVNDLVRFGMTFDPSIYSHHFFVAEVAHEITD